MFLLFHVIFVLTEFWQMRERKLLTDWMFTTNHNDIGQSNCLTHNVWLIWLYIMLMSRWPARKVYTWSRVTATCVLHWSSSAVGVWSRVDWITLDYDKVLVLYSWISSGKMCCMYIRVRSLESRYIVDGWSGFLKHTTLGPKHDDYTIWKGILWQCVNQRTWRIWRCAYH